MLNGISNNMRKIYTWDVRGGSNVYNFWEGLSSFPIIFINKDEVVSSP